MLQNTPLASIVKNAQTRTFPKGQIILYQGDSPDQMYILKSGEVKMYDIDEQGNEKIMHILQPPGIFPFASYQGKQSEILWFYGALTDAEAYIVPFRELRPRMENESAIGVYLLEQVVEEMHEIFVRLNSMSKTTAREKIIAALRFLVAYHAKPKSNGWCQIAFPVSHQLLADMTGITRESATITLGQLQEQSIVKSPRLGVLEVNSHKLNKV